MPSRYMVECLLFHPSAMLAAIELELLRTCDPSSYISYFGNDIVSSETSRWSSTSFLYTSRSSKVEIVPVKSLPPTTYHLPPFVTRPPREGSARPGSPPVARQGRRWKGRA